MPDPPSLDPEQRERLEAVGSSPDTRELTVIFTDLVGFTALRTEVGEQRGLEILTAHQAIVRRLLEDFADGREIKTMGDAFLLAFARPSDAVSFALRLIAAHRGAPDQPPLRIGLHSGEVAVLEREDIFGLQVDIAKRVEDLAGDDQILMTGFVFDNARTRIRSQDLEGVGEIRWERHGFHRLQGVDHPLEICEVGEVDHAPFTAPKGAKPVDRVESDKIDGWRPGLGVAVPATNWILENRLGEGGFGEVWLAHDRTQAARRTVFKFCTRQSKIKSLQRELGVFNALTEESGRTPPGIVEVRGTHDAEPPYYIELEYLAGGDLRRWIEANGQTASLRTKLSLANQMARAVALVHRGGFVHRDIKPSNFLLEESDDPARAPTLKLSDFGIGQAVVDDLIDEARATMAVHSATLSQAAGTYLYIAPELIRPSSTEASSSGSKARIEKRAQPSADLYGLGVALYQLFAGSIDAIPGPGLRAVDDPVLREDITDCLDEDPEDRPTAQELVDRLARYDERTKAAVEEERKRLEHERHQAVALARAGRRTLIAVSGALVVAIGLGAVSLVLRQQAANARDEALVARADAQRLVQFMLTDLHDQLEPIGQLDILEPAAEEVMNYYAGLIPAEQSKETLRYWARAMRNVGEIQYSLGNYEDSLASFDSATEIIRDLLSQEPTNLEYLDDLAVSLIAKNETLDRLRDFRGAVDATQSAVEIRERMVAVEPDDPGRQHDLSVALRNLGFAHYRLGAQGGADGSEAYQAGLSALGSAHEIASDLHEASPDDPDRILNLAGIANHTGLILRMMGDGAGLMAKLHETVELRRRLTELDPENAGFWHSLGSINISILRYAPTPQERIERGLEAVEIYRDLTERDSRNAEWNRNRVEATFKLADNLASEGRHDEAIIHLEEFIAYLGSALESDPGLSSFLSDTCDQLIDTFISAGRPDDALAFGREMVAEAESRLASQPDDPGLRQAHAEAIRRATELQESLREQAEAEQFRRDLINRLQDQVEQSPGQFSPLFGLAGAQMGFGNLLWAHGDAESAAEQWREAIDNAERALEIEPENRQALVLRSNTVWNLSLAIEQLNGGLEALEARRAAIEVSVRDFTGATAAGRDLLVTLSREESLLESFGGMGFESEILEAHSTLSETLSQLGSLEIEGWDADDLNNLSGAFLRRGRRLAQLGDEEGARENWQRAVEVIEPIILNSEVGTVPIPILINHAHALLALGRAEEARPLVERILDGISAIDTDDAEDRNLRSWTLVVLGRAQEGAGDSEGAQITWERAVEIIEPVTQQAKLHTIDTAILDTHAHALLHLERVEEAGPIVDVLLDRDWHVENDDFAEACREHGLLPASASPEASSL